MIEFHSLAARRLLVKGFEFLLWSVFIVPWFIRLTMHSNSNGRMSINLKEDGVETDKVKKINGQIHVADILVQDAEDKLFGKFINGVDEQSPLNWVSKSADEQFDGNFWDEFDDKTSSLDTKSSDEQSDACSSTPEAHYDRANSLPFSSSINILPSPDLSLSTPPQAGGGLHITCFL